MESSIFQSSTALGVGDLGPGRRIQIDLRKNKEESGRNQVYLRARFSSSQTFWSSGQEETGR